MDFFLQFVTKSALVLFSLSPCGVTARMLSQDLCLSLGIPAFQTDHPDKKDPVPLLTPPTSQNKDSASGSNKLHFPMFQPQGKLAVNF